MTTGEHPNYFIVEINKNTEKSPGDLRVLAVSQIPVKKKLSDKGGFKNSSVRNNNGIYKMYVWIVLATV